MFTELQERRLPLVLATKAQEQEITMAKPADDKLQDRRPLPRLYAHYHRLMIELLEDLVADSRVLWLGDEQGHIRRPDGEPNTYRKALYALEDLGPYSERLEALALVQQEGHQTTGVKPMGLLLPGTQTGVRHVVLSHAVSWASHVLPKSVITMKLTAHLQKTKLNLRVFETYASTADPKREKLEQEIVEMEAGLERLETCGEAVLRERARSEKHIARLMLPPDPHTGEETRTVYIRDVGLIVAGAGLSTQAGAIEVAAKRKRRKDRLEGKLMPLVHFGNYEIYLEAQWRLAKEQA